LICIAGFSCGGVLALVLPAFQLGICLFNYRYGRDWLIVLILQIHLWISTALGLYLEGYLYLRYIMNINFGSRQGYIILASVIAGITGIAVGAMIGAVLKSGANTKLGICLAVSMLGSYLAGMMDNTMKYRVMQNAPAVEYINPVGILTDAYLKLFYYKDLSYFWWDIVNLLVIMAVCMTVTIFVLRRQRYDNI